MDVLRNLKPNPNLILAVNQTLFLTLIRTSNLILTPTLISSNPYPHHFFLRTLLGSPSLSDAHCGLIIACSY